MVIAAICENLDTIIISGRSSLRIMTSLAVTEKNYQQ